MSSNAIQAFAAVIQALFAGAIVVVTYLYTQTTRQILELQLSPELELAIPQDILVGGNDRMSVRNSSGCTLTEVQITLSVPRTSGDKPTDPRVCQFRQQLTRQRLKPAGECAFEVKPILQDIAGSLDLTAIPLEQRRFFAQLLVHLSCRRAVDRKPFYWTFWYSVLRGPDHGLYVINTSGERTTSHHRLILQPKTGESAASGEFFLEPAPGRMRGSEGTGIA